jgi:UDP-N-acetylglucosamine:LPS N-acetylglucosamine transferase
MQEQKNVLILTADAGFGHRSAANAIAGAFERLYKDRTNVIIINPTEDKKAPSILRDAQNDYDKFVRNLPDLYKFNYQISDSTVPTAVLESALTVLLFTVIRATFRSFQPDVVITTHPFYMSPVNTYVTLSRLSIPFLTVITDLTNVHRLWFNQGTDLCLLPTEQSLHEAISAGLTPDICKVTGIPVNPTFLEETRSKAEIRAELGWTPGVITALVMGSARVKNILNVLHVLNHSGLPIQLVLVAGGDDKLYEAFRSIEWHTVTQIYNYVEQMPKFMKASDLVIGKAGGLTVTESLACGLPFLLIDVTPGQEEGNANYIIEHGAAERAENPLRTMEVLFHWLQADQSLLKERAKNALILGRPKAAFEVADLAWQAAEKGRCVPSSRLLRWIPRFRELLHNSGISETADN